MITGAPTKGVTAARGITPLWAGNVQSQLHNRAITEPKSIVDGNSRR